MPGFYAPQSYRDRYATALDQAPQWEQNVLPGIAKFASDSAQPFLHPIDTVQGIASLGEGLGQHARAALGGDQPETPQMDAVSQIKQAVVDRAKQLTSSPGQAFSEDPIATVNDISSVIPFGVLGKLGLIGKAGMAGVAAKAGKLSKAEKVAKALEEETAVAKVGHNMPPAYDQEALARRYPELGEEYTAYDEKTGKPYQTRHQSDEEKAVEKVRQQAQKEIKQGKWTRFYDPQKRDYVDPSKYDAPGDTVTMATPQNPETYNQYHDLYNTPEGRKRLLDAYDSGAQFPDAKDWYAMKQWEDGYIKDFGAKEGRRRFRQDFAEGMAATTGGASPTANFLTSQQLNFRRHGGQAPLERSVDAQYPVGGRYLQGNIDQYNKALNAGEGLNIKNPKRFNFMSNFLGFRNRATMDEQMTKGLVPGMSMPKGPSYGVAEKVVHDLAKERGVEPANFQDVAWAGLKRLKTPNYTGQPMIDVINEAIWRTHRVTGLPLEEVARRMRAGTIPTYGIAGAGVGGAVLAGSGPPGQRESGGGA